MIGWGPALVNIAMRRLLPNEAATVGRILSAGEPRDIQFALKLSF